MNPDAAVMLRAAMNRVASFMSNHGTDDARLGQLTLRPHQRDAVHRILEIIGRHRGVLLADAVGLGKTYVALAVAREHTRSLVVCPAALRPMWKRAMAVAGVEVPVLSIESLSRGEGTRLKPDLLIIDEAHHFRTPSTRRYDAAAAIARHSRVLLMTATPVHNSRRDLIALLGLFAGSSVGSWSDSALSRLIVRRDEHALENALPALDGPHILSPGSDDDCLDAIVAMPSPVPAADEGVAAALATITLVHLWSSSRAALVASVRKRRAKALALMDAIDSGHMPTLAELSAWAYAEDTLQLAFPFCARGEVVTEPATMRQHLGKYIASCEALLARAVSPPDADIDRVQLLRTLRARHIGDRIVAFSQYANTVTALARLMRHERGIATITGEGGAIASGRMAREDILRQFGGDAAPANPIERIDLLLATDLLSEGIDLRGAAVIVNLDLPWNPARIEQRIGRARRLGSKLESVHVYTFVPPTAAERMLELKRRLQSKMRIANAMVGAANSALAGESDSMASPVRAAERLREVIAAWRDPASEEEGELLVGAAKCDKAGWVAAVTMDGLPRIVFGAVDGSITDDPGACAEVAERIGEAREVKSEEAAAALDAIRRWLASRAAIAALGDRAAPKRAVLDRLAQTVARAPRHRRAAVLARVQRARSQVSAVNGVGAERIMTTLARSPADDEAWLQAVETFGDINAQSPSATPPGQHVAAIILLG